MRQFMVQNLTSKEGLLKEGVVSIQYLSNSTYVGQTDQNHKKEGNGVYRYSNDDLYWGNWQKDEFHGFGTYSFSNGDIFSGLFRNGQCIEGKLKQKSGNIYEGPFKNGLRNGRGKITFSNGDIYDGEWKHDQMFGRGKYYSKEFEISGNWNSNNLKGQCIIEGPSLKFQGFISDGFLLNGKIKIQYSQSEKFEGFVKNSQRTGSVVYVFSNHSKYEGQFQQDFMNGYGKLYTQKGVYEGMFLHSKPHGEGSFTNSMGDVYIGSWEKGEKHGKGLLKYKNGDKYEGMFVKGVREGKGNYTWHHGETFKGEFHQDMCCRWGDFEKQGNNLKGILSGHDDEKTKFGKGMKNRKPPDQF